MALAPRRERALPANGPCSEEVGHVDPKGLRDSSAFEDRWRAVASSRESCRGQSPLPQSVQASGALPANFTVTAEEREKCRDNPNKLATAPLSVLCGSPCSLRLAPGRNSHALQILARTVATRGRSYDSGTRGRSYGSGTRGRSYCRATRVATAATRRWRSRQPPPPRRIRPGRWLFPDPVSATGRGRGTRCRVHAPVSARQRWALQDGRP